MALGHLNEHRGTTVTDTLSNETTIATFYFPGLRGEAAIDVADHVVAHEMCVSAGVGYRYAPPAFIDACDEYAKRSHEEYERLIGRELAEYLKRQLSE